MFHVLWYEHLLSLFIPHHSSILLFYIILCLFISSLSYSYSFHRFSFLYSSSYSTSHFHSFSSQHTLSSPFFHSVPVLFFNPYRLICHSILSSSSSLITLLPSHSSSRSLSLSFHHLLIILPIHSFTSSSLSHSILIPSFILFHFNATVLSSSSSLFYKPL